MRLRELFPSEFLVHVQVAIGLELVLAGLHRECAHEAPADVQVREDAHDPCAVADLLKSRFSPGCDGHAEHPAPDRLVALGRKMATTVG